MEVARRITLYRLPEPRVAPALPAVRVRPVPTVTGPPIREPAPPRILAVPAGALPAAEGSTAETLMSVSALAGVRAYAETQQLRALRHGEPRDSGSRLDLRL